MGRLLAPITIQNLTDSKCAINVNAFVDTAAAYLTLPISWKSKLGNLRKFRTVQTQFAEPFAEQSKGTAEIYGPVSLKINGFDEISTEVLFRDLDMDMPPDEKGNFEALLGYIPLEQSNAAVDMSIHKLVPVKYVDLK